MIVLGSANDVHTYIYMYIHTYIHMCEYADIHNYANIYIIMYIKSMNKLYQAVPP